ncbi:ATP-dependent DNA helicase [Micrococcus sp.]|uniref:ATP-dependent helicase n=1 Tax=Micrococcus sp. TaxID=1271 RepID=UPI002A9096D9|nr:ATP-dependent DNA helicase [Micrococcus sp.]MDY6055146.1 ATP-dependent DNA helicase [Micrococcus sp.]
MEPLSALMPVPAEPPAPAGADVRRAVHSPEDIAARLGAPPPTPEQSDVIKAPLSPRLVVAGAGSGKTATMSDRVVWLVANGFVRPDQVLGVTFTRKAAGELAHRINAKVDALLRSGLPIPGFEGEPEDLGRASVSTYHSYAGALVRDHGLRVGVEPEAELIGDAEAHRFMAQVADAHPVVADRLGVSRATLVAQALHLAGDLAEHLVEPGRVRAFLREQIAVGEALELPARMKQPSAEIREFFTGLEDRILMADLVERYTELKREREVMDFGDLLRHAADVAGQIPAAGREERERFPVVLLDEFQDTSHAQMRIFAGLFGPTGPAPDAPGLGHCVTAVGDPHQSIYGFRGASAGQLFDFPTLFPRAAAGPDGSVRRAPADVSHLTTAWRNDEAILAVANQVVQPLNAHVSARGAAVDLRPLQPRPGAEAGEVRVDRYETAQEEAEDLVERLRTLPPGPDGQPLTRAVLCRARTQFGPVIDALDAAGVPYEVLGLSGLLDLPEITEVLAVLHLLSDPGRNDQLIRLLTGPRFRIGPADLEVLHERARFVSRMRRRATAAGAEETSTGDVVVSADEDADAPALLEALDSLPGEGVAWTGANGRGFSAEGLARLRRAHRQLRHLSARAGLAPADLIAEVAREIGLDVELALRPGPSAASARRHLDAFQDAARGFAVGSGAAGDLSAFLAWTASVAEHEDGLGITPADPVPGVVQVLTAHASKGLEWDVVAVPGLQQGTFPSDRADRWTTGGTGALPWPLRGDAASLPQWDGSWAQDRRDWVQSAGSAYSSAAAKESAPEPYRLAVEDHAGREERRLAYVAFTRARSRLWLSTSRWKGTRRRPSEPSPFLEEVEALAETVPGIVIGAVPDPQTQPEQNPAGERTLVAWWPFDPLEGPQAWIADPEDPEDETAWQALPPRSRPRRARVESAARQMKAAAPEALAEEGQLAREVEWVLLRRRQIEGSGPDVSLPEHLSVSLYGELAADPQAVAEQLRRPLPTPPAHAARRGTAFHAWLEERFGSTGMLDIDDPTDAADAWVEDALDLAPLQEWFLGSRWADRLPVSVETAVETTVAGITLRGRIDAVYREGGRAEVPFDPEAHWELVDWKTGAVPRGRELERKALQLAVYRLAWSRLHGIPLERISASFVYVARGQERTFTDLPGEEELEQILAEAVGRS